MFFEGKGREERSEEKERERGEGRKEGMNKNIWIWIHIGYIRLYYIFYYYFWSSLERRKCLPSSKQNIVDTMLLNCLHFIHSTNTWYTHKYFPPTLDIWGLSRRYPAMYCEKEIFIEGDTRNIVHRMMTPQSPSKKAYWDLTQVSRLPSAAPLNFPESYQWLEISSLPKMILVLGKARSHWVPNLGCRGLRHLGVLIFCQKLCMRHDAWVVTLLW